MSDDLVGPATLIEAATLVEALRVRGITLATSESLTGGLLGAVITSVPGASAVYVGGAIVYATRMKAVLSGASPQTLATEGAVSRATACELAAGIVERTGADWGVATTGVAGPDLQEGHPAGTVWIGVSGPDGTSAEQRFFPGGRAVVREQTVLAAMALARSAIVRDSSGDG